MDIDLLVESDGLYMTSLPDGASFTWRLLTMKEYQVFSTLRDRGVLSEFQVCNDVFDRCFVGEPMAIPGHLPAGIFLSIGRLIMHLSGDNVGEEAEEINAVRNSYPVNSVTEVMKRIVLMAFSGYTPDDIEAWTRAKLLRNFTLAEAVLQNRSDYEPLDTTKIMTPEQAAKASKKSGLPVDVQQENRDINKEFGDRRHPLDMDPSELAARERKTAKLTAKQARRLDKMEKEIERQKSSGRQRRRR